MSRVGKNPVAVPGGVEIKINGTEISAKGKNGELSYNFGSAVTVEHEGAEISVKPADEGRHARAMWGTARARVQNLVTGVSEGYVKKLTLVGVGYRASVQGSNLNLQLNFSHDVIYPLPEGVSAKCESPTSIEISGADKQLVGQVAAEVRSYRPPEPYKGKGVRYADEEVLRKEGKKK